MKFACSSAKTNQWIQYYILQEPLTLRKTYTGPHSKLDLTLISGFPDTPARYGHGVMSVTEAKDGRGGS